MSFLCSAGSVFLVKSPVLFFHFFISVFLSFFGLFKIDSFLFRNQKLFVFWLLPSNGLHCAVTDANCTLITL